MEDSSSYCKVVFSFLNTKEEHTHERVRSLAVNFTDVGGLAFVYTIVPAPCPTFLPTKKHIWVPTQDESDISKESNIGATNIYLPERYR